MSTFDQILTDETLGRLFGTYAQEARAVERRRLAATELPARLATHCAVCGEWPCTDRVASLIGGAPW